VLILFNRFEQITEQAHLYQADDHIIKRSRRSLCKLERVYYRVECDAVEVIKVLGQQNPEELLS
jgi:toxin ParE1/3/4